jgi:hypothetical protein
MIRRQASDVRISAHPEIHLRPRKPGPHGFGAFGTMTISRSTGADVKYLISSRRSDGDGHAPESSTTAAKGRSQVAAVAAANELLPMEASSKVAPVRQSLSFAH